MGLDGVRLLIVVEDFDLRVCADSVGLSDAQKAQPDSRAQPIDERSAVDSHIFQSATYWRSHFQDVAIYAIYAHTAYNEVSDAGVGLIGSGLPRASSPLDSQLSPTNQNASASWPFADAQSSNQSGPARFNPAKLSQRRSNVRAERDRVRPIADYCPTHVVLCSADASAIGWITRNQIPSIVLLCDWREPLGWWQRWQHRQIIRQLNQPNVAWVGSHGAYACEILSASGINAQKLIPWEWPQPQLPVQYDYKQLRHDRDTIALIYVGPMHCAAGVDDLIRAVSHLHQRQQITYLKLICETSDERAAMGDVLLPHSPQDTLYRSPVEAISAGADKLVGAYGDDSASTYLAGTYESSLNADSLDADLRRLIALVQTLDLTDYVSFVPALPEPTLIREVRAADLVVMPGYDRSWPDTTPPSLQLAMAARSPVVAADHAHFKEHLFHGVNAVIFPEGNAKSMAHRIERVMSQPQLYAQLSEALNIPLHAIKVPARWSDLIDRWLRSEVDPLSSASDYQQLCNWAYSSGRYQGIAPMQKPPQFLQNKNSEA